MSFDLYVAATCACVGLLVLAVELKLVIVVMFIDTVGSWCTPQLTNLNTPGGFTGRAEGSFVSVRWRLADTIVVSKQQQHVVDSNSNCRSHWQNGMSYLSMPKPLSSSELPPDPESPSESGSSVALTPARRDRLRFKEAPGAANDDGFMAPLRTIHSGGVLS